MDKSSDSVHQFASLLLSIVEGLETLAVKEYERVAIESINMLAVSNFQPLGPLWKLSDIYKVSASGTFEDVVLFLF